jgi:hypothetical protein
MICNRTAFKDSRIRGLLAEAGLACDRPRLTDWRYRNAGVPFLVGTQDMRRFIWQLGSMHRSTGE